MRILHACKHFYPRVTGVTAHVEHLALEQRTAGHEVAVAAPRLACELGGNHAPQGMTVLRAADPDVLSRLMRDFAPDIVHVHSIWDVTHMAVRVARRLRRPYAVTTHGTWQFFAGSLTWASWPERLRWNLWRRRVLWPRLLRRAGVVIALNALEARDALAAGVAAGRVVRIPNAVDAGLFHPPSPDDPPRPGETAASGAGNGEDTFPVLFVGAMEANKGVFELVAAASLLRESLPGVRWLLAGDGPDLEEARRAARESGAEGVVTFLGRVGRSEMPALYRSVRAVAAPSRMEAFSTVLLEAMASGLPCVGSDVGGTPDIVDHGETGLLVPPQDAAALAEAVRWLVRHPRESLAMGQAGREKAEREFAWKHVAGRIEKAYRLALAALLAGLFLCSPVLAARVFPVDILTMVDPRTGLDATSASAGWRKGNAVWDGRTVRMAAARGEAAAFQLVLFPDPGERLDNIRIAVDLPESISWQAFRAWHIWDAPEVAVPLGASGTPFSIPAASLAEREVTRDYAAFATVVEVVAPRNATASEASGHVRIAWDGGGATLPLALNILPFDLPRRPSFGLEMNSYGDYLRLLSADRQTFLDLHRLFRRFRATFTLVPYRQDNGPVLDFLAPAVSDAGTADFAGFDAALAGLFDGSAFADGQPLDLFVLPLRAGWPVAQEAAPEAYAARNIRLRLALARHIRDKGWASTRFQEFHNENPEQGARVPWRLDEPATAADLAGHALFLGFHDALGRDFGPDAPVRYRIDISDWRPLRSGLGRLAGRVTDWSISASPAFLDREAVRFFRQLGGERLTAYGELPGFAVDGRATPWWRFPSLLGRYAALGMDGYAQWQVDRWRGRPRPGLPREAEPLFYSNAAGARDLIWPGMFFGVHGALPSLRLFALREGQNMLDYLALASHCRPDLADGLRERSATLAGAEEYWTFKRQLTRLATGRCGS